MQQSLRRRLLQTPPPVDGSTLAHLLLSHHNPFHPLESPLQLTGLTLTPDLIHQTLLHLRHHSKPALAFFVWAKTHALHGPHDSRAYNLLIDSLARVRQFDTVWVLIGEMVREGVEVDGETVGVMVRRLVAAGLTRQAVRAWEDLEGFVGRENGRGEFCRLLDTLCKYGYAKMATEIFNQRKFKYEPDEKMYTILIYGWCKINRLDMARRFLQEISERGLEPNVVTYNVMLNGICRKASLHPDTRFDRTIQAAEALFEEMQSRGIQPDVSSFSIVLHVYSRAHKPELSLTKFREMKEKGISPTIATYTSVIKCLASCGRLEDAEELLNEMVKEGVHPSPATYNCFFKEYRGRKDVEGAMKLYRSMKEDNFLTSPDMHTYNILIGMMLRLDKMGLLWELWDDMKESGVGPDLDAYTMLIHGLCGKQKWKEACQFFMDMIEKGFLPQKITFETLYRGLIQSDKLRTWRRLKKKVDEEAHKFRAEFQQYQFKPYKR